MHGWFAQAMSVPLVGNWPIDQDLDKAITNSVQLQIQLAGLAATAMAEDQVLLAGIVHTFSNAWDVVARVDHRCAPSFAGPTRVRLFSMAALASASMRASWQRMPGRATRNG